MKPTSRFTRLLIPSLLIVALAAGACSSPVVTGGGGKTILVTDDVGREVAVPEQVERIACLFAVSGHAVTMLGRGEAVVAVVEGLHRDLVLNSICPSIGDAAVPITSGVINIEELLSVDPDVVFIQESTFNSEGETEKLDKVGLPWLVVSFSTIEEQKGTIEMIGRAIGRLELAQRFNEFYQECVDLVTERVAAIPEADRIRVYHSVNEATRTDKRGTLPAEWTEMAGAVNVSLDQDLRLLEDKYFASLEQILLWNPDVIIVNEDGVTDYILENPQWSPLKAVKQGKVYQMPNGVSRWGHPNSLETPLALVWTADLLYPELFADVDLEEMTRGFYQEFFRYELTDDELHGILSGRGMRIPKN